MKSDYLDCPIEATFKVIGGKWKAISMYYLIDGPKRFGDLMTLLETVSPRMLTKQLKELEADGVIERTVFGEISPRVEYSLTVYGKTLMPLINSICEWGEGHLELTGGRAVYN